MAWLEKRGQRFLLVFRLNGARYKKLLDLTDRREADAVTAKVERRIKMLERGEWQLRDRGRRIFSSTTFIHCAAPSL